MDIRLLALLPLLLLAGLLASGPRVAVAQQAAAPAPGPALPPAGWHDVTAYGAVPDDSGDDTDAIQRALDAVGPRGGVVYLPSGIYRLARPLYIRHDGTILQGNGKSCILRSEGNRDAVIKILSTEREPVRSFENVILEKFAIHGVDQKPTGIMATGFTRGGVIRDLWIERCRDAIDLTGSWSFAIERNNIVRCAGIGISLGNAELSDPVRTHNTSRVVNAVQILGNTVRGCATGLDYSVGSGSFIAGNTFELNDANAVFRNVRASAVLGNYFEAPREPTPLFRLGGPGEPSPAHLLIAANLFYAREEGVSAIEAHGLKHTQILANRINLHETAQAIHFTTDDPAKIQGNEILTDHAGKSRVPESADAPGTPGTIVWDGDFIYVCTGPNQWKRVRLSEW